MSNMILSAISIFIAAMLIGGSVYVVSKKSTQKSVLISGLTMLVFGLAGSLFVNLIPYGNGVTTATMTYLVNFYLLVAGIGGNFIVGAAVMKSVATRFTLSGTVDGYMSLPIAGTAPANATAKIEATLGGFADEV